MEQATFAAGCFWGIEATFRAVPGVTATRVGYVGGAVEQPTYEQVCTGTTGHAEAVEVTFDPAQVTYEQLLAVLWANHDPTTRDRQGPDIGSQYRSGVFFHDANQQAAAQASKQALEDAGRFARPIVTEIVEVGRFWEAEEYHQQYFEKHGRSHCQF